MTGVEFTAVKQADVEKMVEKGLFALKEQALTDCNYYVRQDQGILRDSARAEQKGLEIELTWNTPYAKRVYYTGRPSKDVNPNASLQWCEVAANAHGDEWAKIIEKAME